MCGQGLLGRMAKLAGLSVTVDDEGKYGPGAYSDEMPYFVAGGERMVDFILLPVKDEAGRITFLAPTGTDITDRKRAEEALQQSDRRKDEFLAILAHELRNPLAPIRNILVVDDNKDAAMSLAMMLKFMGNEAKTAHDGLEALDVAGAFRPDLILLDIGMPRLNGYETAKRIREQPGARAWCWSR